MGRTTPIHQSQPRDRSTAAQDRDQSGAVAVLRPDEPAPSTRTHTRAHDGAVEQRFPTQFTLESAYGSVPALDSTREPEDVSREAKMEKASSV